MHATCPTNLIYLDLPMEMQILQNFEN